MALTRTGRMRPDDVAALSGLLPSMDGWIGKANREDLTLPIAEFRHMMTRLKLIRRYDGKLLPTRAGAAAAKNPDVLWRNLADRLPAAARPGHVEHEAWLLILACHAAGHQPDMNRTAQALGQAGWANPDHTPPTPDTIRHTTRLPDTITGNLARHNPTDTPVPGPTRRYAYDTLTRPDKQNTP